ncbi:uncharacterized protein LOC101746715 [Bombyx mori]|uniref:ascorbate ferrireductase (transmembrane) n=1 Tax=Bombyx mori TaxID=7091 RepID=A0A8R1WI71_BOMMO|nr:uncharacterized protein LOC101746715 [Bombyx mori]
MSPKVSERSASPPLTVHDDNYKIKIFHSTFNLITHILIGVVVGISVIFSFRNGTPLGATPLHIVLCVVGYQLLMAEAILSLSPHNGWSSNLKLVDKRRAHWILQTLGSGLAIVGSFIKIIDKSTHLNTLHGKFAIAALVFTTVSLINGLGSLWAFELRRYIPINVSKLIHIGIGIFVLPTSSIALCYGFDKSMFKSWISDEVAFTLIGCTSAFTVIISFNSFTTFHVKLWKCFKS